MDFQQIYVDKSRGGEFYSHLRCQKKRRKRYGSGERRGQIKNRVSIENTNGLIRQYIPRKKDIDDLSDEEVAAIIENDKFPSEKMSWL